MAMSKTTILELGYFIDDLNQPSIVNYQTLVRTVEDGVVLPSLWTSVDEGGNPNSLMDAALGCTEFVSFVEIPEDGAELQYMGSYGLGFAQDFLARQGVDPVEYILFDGDALLADSADWLQDRLTGAHENPGIPQFAREQMQKAFLTLRENPKKQAMLHDRIAIHVNDTRTYYEIVRPNMLDDNSLAEWRGTQPIHFTLDDIQTVYVASIDEVSHFRLMYPGYTGTFAVLY